jgi:hypothetical protein
VPLSNAKGKRSAQHLKSENGQDKQQDQETAKPKKGSGQFQREAQHYPNNQKNHAQNRNGNHITSHAFLSSYLEKGAFHSV